MNAGNGRIKLWWRDDDAHAVTPELETMLALRQALDIPLALAVIPSLAETQLRERLRNESSVNVLVHGYRHENHAPPGQKKAEFTHGRRSADMNFELRQGMTILTRLEEHTLPVLVPPWNRCPVEVIRNLPALGFRGYSAFGANAAFETPSTLTIVNTHVDVVDWKNGARTKSLLELETELHALIARRRHVPDPEPIGILTHHLRMNPEAFAVLEAFFRPALASASFLWPSARNMFEGAKQGGHD